MRPFHKVAAIALCMSLAGVFSCPAVRAEIVDRIVANVNGQIILYSDLQRRIHDMARRMPMLDVAQPAEKLQIEREVLNEMIEQKLADMEAARLKVMVSDSEVDEQIQNIMQQNHITLDQIKRNLKARGETYKKFREDVKRDLQRQRLIDRVLKSKILITNRQVEDYLKGKYGKYASTSSEVHLAVILLPVGGDYGTADDVAKKGREILDKLKNGADFSKLAKEYSKEPSAPEGGDLGYVEVSDLAPYIVEAIHNLRENQVSGLVQSPGGYYILKVLGFKRNKIKTSDLALREKVRKILYQEEVQRKFQEWVHDLESKAFIQIYL